MPGDVLFFSNTVFAGLSHVAIYIGNGQMIGADSFAVGVTTDNLSAQYWMEHYTGATRPLAVAGTATTTTAPAQPVATDTPTATATPAPPVVASAPVGTRLQPLSTTVGVYSGPGYQYTSLGILTPSTLLTVVQEQNGWYDVSFQDAHMVETFGWVNAADVESAGDDAQTPATATMATATPTPTDTATPRLSPTPPFSRAAAATGGSTDVTLMVVAGPLNVRSGPGKQFAPIGSVKKGAHLALLERSAPAGTASPPQPD